MLVRSNLFKYKYQWTEKKKNNRIPKQKEKGLTQIDIQEDKHKIKSQNEELVRKTNGK